MKKKIALISALCMMAMPLAHAEPTGYTINIVNHSKYFKTFNYKLLYDYLYEVSLDWPIYHGTYTIYLYDYMPKADNYIVPSDFVGYHLPGAKAYIDAKKAYQDGFQPYYAITHELAEMAVDPNLTYFDANNKLVEICDNLEGAISIFDYNVVAPWQVPSDFNLG
jgi:hypothetical protein